MRLVCGIALLSLTAALPAAAMETVSRANAPQVTTDIAAMPSDSDARSTRSFAAEDEHAVVESAWEPEPIPTPGQMRCTRLQTDELAARLGFVDGKADWIRFNLKDADGNGPTIAGTFDHGAAMLKMRWKDD